MSDPFLLKEILMQILEGIRKVERRFKDIESVDDFQKNDEGIDRLDGIVMMLIVIGESLKNFERSGGKNLMDSHPDMDWKSIKRIRDFLSHHYFDVDTELVFAICKYRISELKKVIIEMQRELNDEIM